MVKQQAKAKKASVDSAAVRKNIQFVANGVESSRNPIAFTCKLIAILLAAISVVLCIAWWVFSGFTIMFIAFLIVMLIISFICYAIGEIISLLQKDYDANKEMTHTMMLMGIDPNELTLTQPVYFPEMDGIDAPERDIQGLIQEGDEAAAALSYTQFEEQPEKDLSFDIEDENLEDAPESIQEIQDEPDFDEFIEEDEPLYVGNHYSEAFDVNADDEAFLEANADTVDVPQEKYKSKHAAHSKKGKHSKS